MERNRHVFSEEGVYGVAVALGYVLGETMVQTFGGTWFYDKEWRVHIESLGCQR